jgi:hypothetical protein
MGKNGIDENGKGGDILQVLRYKDISDWFEDPHFDGKTYKKYYGKSPVVKKNGLFFVHYPASPEK